MEDYLKDQDREGMEATLRRRDWALLVGGAAASLQWGCSKDRLRAGGYESKEIPQVGSVRLPGPFALVPGVEQRAKRLAAGTPQEVQLLGEQPENPLNANIYAISSVFAFHEQKSADGQLRAGANLILSRMSDQQAFAGAQSYYEYAAEICPHAWWKQPKSLVWKQETSGKNQFLYAARLEDSDPKSGEVLVLMDREHLVETMLVGDAVAFDRETGVAILVEAAKSFGARMAMEDYFARVGKAAARQAEQRRKNYITLLETLEREQLDYSPTPRAVIFNSNLVCQFWWAAYDRSGVPASFAIVGRLGALKAAGAGPEEFGKAVGESPGMRVFAAEPLTGGQWKLRVLDRLKPGLERSRAVVSETGWMSRGEVKDPVVFASLEFSFDEPIPSLSRWLDELEALARTTVKLGLVAAP